MSVRPILAFPDPRLRQAAVPVTQFDAELAELARDLLEAMRAAPGVGIAAAHIGERARLAVIELPEAGGPRIYVNPAIVWASPETVRGPEGSVSMPGIIEEVERAARVRVAYQDLGGAAQSEEADGFLAVCLQHEIDQLDGLFWIYRLSRVKRERLLRRRDKLSRAF